MAVVSTGQITITDQNDYIFTGTTAPLNPIANITLWIDTSLSPSQQKRWTGSKWEIVNEVVIGGRNLALNSKKRWETNSYYLGHVDIAENLKNGDTITITAWGELSPGQNLYVGLSPSTADIAIIPKENGIYSKTITFNINPLYPNDVRNRLVLYNFPPTGNQMGFIEKFQIEKGNRATDHSPAPEDAETAINAINSTLSDFANDNKLTPDEKHTVKKEWDVIAGEYPKLVAQADNLLVSRTVFAGVYSALTTYITPLISNMGTASDIVGSTFRNNFTNYYNARIDLQNAMTARVQTNLTNTKPGGKNYLVGSRIDNLSGWVLDGGTAVVVVDANYKKVVEYSRPSGGYNFMKTFIINSSELKNTELVFYCIAKPITTNPIFAFGGWSETAGTLNQRSAFRDLGDGWRMYHASFTSGAAIASSGTFGLNSVGGTWRFHSFGVCKGNQPPSDWIAAPEDTQSQIDAADYLKTAIAQSVNVNGGLVLAAALCARNANGNVTAYLNGLTQKPFAIAAGVQNWGEGNETARSWIDFEGNAKFGNLRIGVNGDGKTWIEDQSGVTRFQFSVDSIETLSSLLVAAGQNTNVSVSSFTTDAAGDYPLTQTITVNANETELVLNGSIIAHVAVIAPSSASCVAVLQLYRNGVLYATITQASVSIAGVRDDFETEESTAIVPFNTKLVGVPAGVYSIRLFVDTTKSGIHASCQAQTSNISILAFKSNDKRAMVFGADGMSLFWNQSAYFHLKNGACTARGLWDIPSGLGGASITAGGGVFANWGKIAGIWQIVKSGSNYTITHNIGDTNYSLILTPISSNVPYFSSKSANTIVVTCAGGFDFVLIRTQ